MTPWPTDNSLSPVTAGDLVAAARAMVAAIAAPMPPASGGKMDHHLLVRQRCNDLCGVLAGDLSGLDARRRLLALELRHFLGGDIDTELAVERLRQFIVAMAGRKRNRRSPNAERDAWVARRRDKGLPWQDIYNEMVVLAPRKGWNLPNDPPSLGQAYRRLLADRRKAGGRRRRDT